MAYKAGTKMLHEPSTEPSPDRLYAVPFDEHLVLVRDDQDLVVLNPSARLIWEALEQGADAREAAHSMALMFGLSPEQASSDVEAALAEWRARGLMERTPPARPATSRRRRPVRPPSGDFALDRIYALCGHPIRFRFRDPDAQSLLYPLLSPYEMSGATAREVIDLYRDGADHVVLANGEEIGRSRLAEDMLAVAVGRVLEVSYPEARWLAVLHAGAVANQDHAIVMPAVSGSGKSTLTAALVHVGLRYLSDDVVPLDGRTSHVLPVPLASSLKRGSWPVLAARFQDLERLPTYREGGRDRRYLDLSARACTMPEGVPVAALVFPQYRPVGPTTLRALRPGQALERILLAHCWISLDRDDLAATLQWIRSTPAYTFEYSSIDEAASTITRLLLG